MVKWQYWEVEVGTSIGKALNRTDLGEECEDAESYGTLDAYIFFKEKEPTMSKFTKVELTEFYKKVKSLVGAKE